MLFECSYLHVAGLEDEVMQNDKGSWGERNNSHLLLGLTQTKLDGTHGAK